jgi:oxygen-independent coproporphyrinogen-3 oxidase
VDALSARMSDATDPHFLPIQRSAYNREAALASLAYADPEFPPSAAATLLAEPANEELLRCVSSDAFTHVFPGDNHRYQPDEFFSDLDAELACSPCFHLWAEIPLCRYRCHFCEFPILVLGHDHKQGEALARRWVDANIREAGRWLEAVPAMRSTPVGEFCLFGGTPTAIPMAELARLFDYYRTHFVFDDQTELRIEGSPDTLTPATLSALRELGFSTLTFGIQSFDDELLALANRRHTVAQAEAAITEGRRAGFTRVDGDLVWGLPGQRVAGFVADVERMIALGFDTVVAMKLHLRSPSEVDSAVGNVRPAAWEQRTGQEAVARRGHRWPSLGEQYQMREAAVERLGQSGYYEHPTTYFPSQTTGVTKWRALNLDQDKQYPQVGIGLGGYTWSSRSEAQTTADPAEYMEAVAADRIPLATVTQISPDSRSRRAVRMALSTCQPVHEDEHCRRFPDSPLLAGRFGSVFNSLEERGLMRIDRNQGVVAVTEIGATLIEAIINTEI